MQLVEKLMVAGLAAILAGCGKGFTPPTSSAPLPLPAQKQSARVDPMKLVLMPQMGDARTDREIRRYQELIPKELKPETALEKLGWLFIAKARESFDPGYYKQAEACADVLAADRPGSAESLLLRGYVFENLHRFKEAEPIARELATRRGLPFDFGLLGDSLMEQGKLDEAVAAYQSMVNLRPDLESYSRVAHIRWLKGDADGAMEAMQLAVSASSPRDPEASAWVNTKFAGLQFMTGNNDGAESSATAALTIRPNYPPALLLRGRMLLAQDQPEAAVQKIQTATQANPLPEYQWALAEALRASGRDDEALTFESQLKISGEANDPRTLSLFLATRGEDVAKALRLAEAELLQRQDIFTEDAAAWAMSANGRIVEAQAHMAAALATGTEDARLFFHAAVISQKAGQTDLSQQWFARAVAAIQALLPSERQQLLDLAEKISTNDPSPILTAAKASSANQITVEK